MKPLEVRPTSGGQFKPGAVHFGDAGYIGASRYAPECTHQWHIAAKRGSVKAIEDKVLRELTEQIEHIKASIRVAVEHPFRVIKRQFGHVKARYLGLAKTGHKMQTLFALGNLWMARKCLLHAG
jgi:IS5 family transposase